MKDQRPYLHDLLARIQMIQDFTVEGREDFVQSLKTQESVIRCFEVIGEIIKRLSPDLLTPYPHIPWRQFTGFRDVLIHQYEKIDLKVVWDAIEQDIPQLKAAVEMM
jgi:uncharacterized protein with HEPN domain